MLNPFRPAEHQPLLPVEEQNRRIAPLRWQILEATFLGYTFYYFTRNNLPIVSLEAASDLTYSSAQMGLLMGATGLAYGIGKFILGALSDRSNPRAFMPAGLLLSAALNFLFGAASNFWIHLGLWTLNGFVQGAGWPPCGRSLGHWYSKSERGTVFGFWNIAHNIGGGLIGPLAAAAASAFGWRSAFYIPGILAVLAAVYLMIRLRDTPQSVGLRSIEAFPPMSNAKYLIALIASVLTGNAIAGAVMYTLLPYEQLPAAVTMLNLVLIPACFWVIGMLPGNRASPPSRLSAAIPAHDVSLEKELSLWEILWNNVLTNKIIWLFAIANLFVYVVRYSLIDWGPTYLKQAKGASMQTGGFSTLAFEASAIVSTLLIGWISDKSGGRRGMVSLICMIPVFLAFLGMIVMPPGFLWAHIVLFGVVGFFIYPPVMVLGVAGLDFTSKKAVGAAAGFIGLLGYTGKFVEGIALGVLSKELGWPGALSFIAASCIVAILMLAFTWKLKPAE